MAEEQDKTQSPDQHAKQLYEDSEAKTAKALEDLVHQESFGELLAKVTSNVIGVMRIGGDAADLVVGNLRLAGRRDVISLQRQLARTEDKLEQVLQEVERLQDELREARDAAGRNGAGAPSTSGRESSGRSKTS
jgi:hypothetical protein